MTRRVQALTVSECRELLKEHHFGRLAFVDAVGVLPVIIPVNYLLDEDTVVFRTDAGSKLDAAVRGAPVAFEVDGVDQDRQVGWSVVVRGRAEVVTDPVKLADLRQTPLVAWHPRANQRYVRIKPSQVIGRRIAIADLPPNWWGNSLAHTRPSTNAHRCRRQDSGVGQDDPVLAEQIDGCTPAAAAPGISKNQS